MSDAPPPSHRDDDDTTRALPAGIDQLLDVMARLRDPAGGCPWDLEQSFETIAPYTIEEAYEVAEAIRQGGPGGAPRRTRRPAPPGRLPRADGARGRQFRLRRGRARHCREDDSPPSPRLRRRRSRCPRLVPGANPSLGVSKGGRARTPERWRKGARPACWTVWRWPSLPCCAPRNCKSGPRVWASTGRRRPPVFDKVLEEVAELREAAAKTDSATSADSTVSEELGDLLFRVRQSGAPPRRGARGRAPRRQRQVSRPRFPACGEGRWRNPVATRGEVGLAELDRLWEEAKQAGRRLSSPPGDGRIDAGQIERFTPPSPALSASEGPRGREGGCAIAFPSTPPGTYVPLAFRCLLTR